jgi:hypothetical protein
LRLISAVPFLFAASSDGAVLIVGSFFGLNSLERCIADVGKTNVRVCTFSFVFEPPHLATNIAAPHIVFVGDVHGSLATTTQTCCVHNGIETMFATPLRMQRSIFSVCTIHVLFDFVAMFGQPQCFEHEDFHWCGIESFSPQCNATAVPVVSSWRPVPIVSSADVLEFFSQWNDDARPCKSQCSPCFLNTASHDEPCSVSPRHGTTGVAVSPQHDCTFGKILLLCIGHSWSARAVAAPMPRPIRVVVVVFGTAVKLPDMLDVFFALFGVARLLSSVAGVAVFVFVCLQHVHIVEWLSPRIFLHEHVARRAIVVEWLFAQPNHVPTVVF